MPPAASLALSASASIRCLYSAVKLRRLALATTSGLGRSAIPRSPTVALRSSSLRSASLRSTDMAGEDVFVFFMLNFLPVLLCNQWYEKCLSYIGTEGCRRVGHWPNGALGSRSRLVAKGLPTAPKRLRLLRANHALLGDSSGQHPGSPICCLSGRFGPPFTARRCPNSVHSSTQRNEAARAPASLGYVKGQYR